MPEEKINNIRGIIFDLDGTLIDSFHAIMEGFNATLPLYGLEQLTLAESKAVVGLPLSDTLGEMVGEENANEATRTFRKRYKEVYLEKTTPMPHADETIGQLYNRGYKLGVATNKHGGFSRDIIDHLGWGDAISTVVGEGDTVYPKPEPDMIIKNLDAMALSSGEAVFVGDSPVDIATGRNAAVKTIAVPTGHHTEKMLVDAGAEIIINDLSKLESII